MAVKIGHSSIDENGKAHSGQAGDSTLKEVCTRSWYKNSWHTVLRPIDPEVAEKMASACEAGCANNNIGYDQWQRNTLRTQAKAVNWDLSKITVPCECDCSSFMSVCAECAGVAIPYDGGNAPSTRTMDQKEYHQTYSRLKQRQTVPDFLQAASRSYQPAYAPK